MKLFFPMGKPVFLMGKNSFSEREPCWNHYETSLSSKGSLSMPEHLPGPMAWNCHLRGFIKLADIANLHKIFKPVSYLTLDRLPGLACVR